MLLLVFFPLPQPRAKADLPTVAKALSDVWARHSVPLPQLTAVCFRPLRLSALGVGETTAPEGRGDGSRMSGKMQGEV